MTVQNDLTDVRRVCVCVCVLGVGGGAKATCMYVCMNIYILVCMYVYTYVCMYVTGKYAESYTSKKVC